MKLMKYSKLYFVISMIFIIPGLISLVMYGLKPAIDFTGGSLLEVQMTQVENLSQDDKNKIEEIAAGTYDVTSVQDSGGNQVIIRGKNISNDQKNEVISNLENELADVEELRFETVGPTLGKELLMKTLMAVAIVSIMVTFYVWYQFHDLMFGVSAILAMFHDSIILLGVFSILGHFYNVEVDVLFVTALLTTLSFSIHDTIVVYDRIRELKKKFPKSDLESISNAAVLETLGRSVNNSITIIIMLLSLVLLGGETIRWFAVALLVGAISGTYSSTFVAVPLLGAWEKVFGKSK